MAVDRGATPSTERSLRTSLLGAWLVAGTADILVAVTYYPLTAAVTPVDILHGIASGLLGRASFTGGVGTAVLGLACHYCIAFIWTGVFFLAYPRLAVLRKSIPITAILYGTFVSVVMSFVVLPLSRVARRPFDPWFFVVATVILMFTIGLPLSLFARRHYAGLT